jgi:hypothetical protein
MAVDGGRVSRGKARFIEAGGAAMTSVTRYEAA